MVRLNVSTDEENDKKRKGVPSFLSGMAQGVIGGPKAGGAALGLAGGLMGGNAVNNIARLLGGSGSNAASNAGNSAPEKGPYNKLNRRMALPQQQERDPIEELLEALNTRYQGTMPGFDDAEAIAALDAALGNTLSGIQGIRDRTQSNFEESNQNVAAMHNAFRSDVQTNGANTYNQTADQYVSSVGANRDEAVNAINQRSAEAQAKRTAMLRSLGIEAAAAAPESTEDQEAINSIISRADINKNYGEQQRATNLNYNTGVASSIGAQGLERQSELRRQLGEAMSTIDAKEMDARSAYQQQRAALASQKAGNQNNLAQFEYGMYQDEQAGIRDLLDQMLSSQGEDEPMQISGYAGLAQDLINSGIDPNMASSAMQAQAEIIGSQEYMRARARGQDSTSFIVAEMQRRGIPASVAVQLVTNYNNLGNTSKYAAMQ